MLNTLSRMKLLLTAGPPAVVGRISDMVPVGPTDIRWRTWLSSRRTTANLSAPTGSHVRSSISLVPSWLSRTVPAAVPLVRHRPWLAIGLPPSGGTASVVAVKNAVVPFTPNPRGLDGPRC